MMREVKWTPLVLRRVGFLTSLLQEVKCVHVCHWTVDSWEVDNSLPTHIHTSTSKAGKAHKFSSIWPKTDGEENLGRNSPSDVHAHTQTCMQTHMHTHKHMQHTLILPPEERMFVRKECLSFLLQKTFAPNISVCFPCSNTRVLTSTQAPLGPPTNSMLAWDLVKLNRPISSVACQSLHVITLDGLGVKQDMIYLC